MIPPEVVLLDDASDEPRNADIWYLEPIIEDDEVEYAAFCHIKTLLTRSGCVPRPDDS